MNNFYDLAWAAGILDGEGCIYIRRHKNYSVRNKRVTPQYVLVVQVVNTDKKIIDKLNEIVLGNIYERKPEERRKLTYCWNLVGGKAEGFLKQVLPFLVSKKERALLSIQLRDMIKNYIACKGNPLSEEEITKRDILCQKIKNLNGRKNYSFVNNGE